MAGREYPGRRCDRPGDRQSYRTSVASQQPTIGELLNLLTSQRHTTEHS
jgi:hypothetical protein